MTTDELITILDLHGKWLRGEKGGSMANLRGADLIAAYLSTADLRMANLYEANLSGANPYGANLCRANLCGANMIRAYLRGAKLDDSTIMPEGITWGRYLSEAVPALCTAGGKSLEEVAAAWDCREWKNCPMHVAFGIESEEQAPAHLVGAVRDFVSRFDNGLIPRPTSIIKEPTSE